MKKCIVVLGMHRSGTSVLSGLVSLMGCYIGLTDTMPKRKDNPKGFFENYRIYKFNQNILEENSVSWDEYNFTVKTIDKNTLRKYIDHAKTIIQEEFKYVNLFFIKDPRMCILYPIWETALKELKIEIKCIITYRSVIEVSLSLERRNQFAFEKSMMIWSHYLFQSEKNSRNTERIFIRFNQDFKDLNTLLIKLTRFVGVILTEEFKRDALKFYTTELQHHVVDMKNTSDEVPSYLKTLINLLMESDYTNHKKIDRLRKDFNNSKMYYLYNDINLKTKNKILENDLNITNQKYHNKAKELKQISYDTKQEYIQQTNKIDAEKIKNKKIVDENNKLNNDIVKKHAINVKLEENNSQLKTTIQKKINENEAFINENGLLNEEIDKLKSDIVFLEVNNTSFVEDIVGLKKENETYKNQHIKSSAEIETLRKKLISVHKSLENNKILFSEDIVGLKKENDDYKNQNKRNNIEIEILKKKFISINERLVKTQQTENKNFIIANSIKTNQIKRISELKNRLLTGELFLNKMFMNKDFSHKISKNIKTPSKLSLILSPLISSKQKSKLLKDKTIIIKSKCFSPFYYLTRYQDIWESDIDPLEHYCLYGWKELRDPNAAFSTSIYLDENIDVKKAGINPLVHYVLHGKKEDRNTGYSSDLGEYKTEKILTTTLQDKHKIQNEENTINLKKVLADTTLLTKKKNIECTDSTCTQNNIFTDFVNGCVDGWIKPTTKLSTHIVKINGMPTRSVLKGITNPENSSTNVFFQSQSISSVKNPTVELLELSQSGITSIYKKKLLKNWTNIEKYSDLKRALEISQAPGAVAITVWEGAHNPIGRAKVLYDIVSSKRPVIIFAYIFGDYGKEIWKPLRNTDINVVLIPYEERYRYQAIITNYNISFDTVWICKYRLHSFELASMLANSETKCILDIDDNEGVFLETAASKLKPYGIFSRNKAEYYLRRIKIRSVASVSIQNIYGGDIIRHARKTCPNKNIGSRNNQDLTAVFIGTIRAHKNITNLVEAIAQNNKLSSVKVKLAIGGDFNPVSLKDTLKTQDTIILGSIASEELYNTLSKYDVIITGFPSVGKDNRLINKLQITSKIGDGLAIGLPVLTPLTEAVEDLKSTPGLFLFTKENFSNKLKAAIEYKKEIKLPEDFTIPKAYKTFEQLERRAKNKSKAKQVFGFDPFYMYKKGSHEGVQNVVLIWKQHDSGVYGRRIDHIARYYKQTHPSSKVTVVEIINNQEMTNLTASNVQFDNFSIVVSDVLKQKVCKFSFEGVNYKLITYADNTGWNSFNQKFKGFLDSENIYPTNTVMVLFPLHKIFNEILSITKEFKTIVDLVDNQIKWISKVEQRIEGLRQYYDLITVADEVVSNSVQNIEYFNKLKFFENKTPKTIQNWYTIPESTYFKRELNDGEVNLIYSGNLNDRINWDLLNKTCKILDKNNGYLHIVGTSIRSSESMKKLLENENCIYHGVVNEVQLLKILQHINFTVVPHVEDKISKFMDPIKLKMYKKIGIKSLTSMLPGLPLDDPMLIVSESEEDFIYRLTKMIKNIEESSSCTYTVDSKDKIGDKYIGMIEKLFNSIKMP